MSDSASAIAQGFVTIQAASTQQQLGIEMLRQKAQSETAVVALLQDAARTGRAGRRAGLRRHGRDRLPSISRPSPLPVAPGPHRA